MSQQRIVILQELKKLHSHPSAAELYELVRRRLPKISLGTVYRNLDILERNAQIRKLETTGGESRYDGDLTDHLHIRCRSCGRLADIHGASFAVDESLQASGYLVTGYRVEFEGYCPVCQEHPGTWRMAVSDRAAAPES